MEPAMLSRHDISDEHWNRIQPLKAGQAGQHGSVGHVIQLFINAIRFLAISGIAWAHLPRQAQQSLAALQPLV